MTVLIAPAKFKGSLSAKAVTAVLARACRRRYPTARIVERPLADGGEGTLSVLREVLPLKPHRLEVPGPLRKPVTATYLMGEGKAYLETAAACGLQFVPPHRRDPGRATSIGVGMLIDDALARGAQDVVLFLGGSATNDGGAGMAGALGYRFFSDRGHDFIPTGNSLGYTARIDLTQVHPLLAPTRFTAVCDVDNPLLGPNGATYMYAPQKGAMPNELPALESHLTRFTTIVNRDLVFNVPPGAAYFPGSGAAGGLGFACLTFLRATLRPGIDVLLDAVGFDDLLARADLIVTGEGSIDAQTARGKVVSGVAKAARARGVPVIAFAGRRSVGPDELPGLTAIHTLMEQPGMTTDRAMTQTAEVLEQLAVDWLP